MKNILVLILGLLLIGCHAPVNYLKSEFIVSKIEHHYNEPFSGSVDHYLIRLEQIYDHGEKSSAFTPIYLEFKIPAKPEYKIGDILVLTVK